MQIHIISLFGESMIPYLNTSIMKRAQEKGLFEYRIHNLCDWTVRNTRRVDDRPYGWGAGTIITIEPLTYCLREIQEKYGQMLIYIMSPRWTLLDQKMAETLKNNTTNQPICIICGHYEWIDERIYDLFDIEEISIGEYVLSSGELSGLVLIDSIVRLIPGVLSEASLREESFSDALNGKKEYPQYSRPEVFEWIAVPSVLLSGNQKEIQKWKKENLRM